MRKRVIPVVLLFALVGVVVAGAVNHTLALVGTGSGAGRESAGGGGLAAGSDDDPGSTDPSDAVEMDGVVALAAGENLVILTSNGLELELGERALAYAQRGGLVLRAGDLVVLRAMREGDGRLAILELTDPVRGLTVVLRQADGRPQWAGDG